MPEYLKSTDGEERGIVDYSRDVPVEAASAPKAEARASSPIGPEGQSTRASSATAAQNKPTSFPPPPFPYNIRLSRVLIFICVGIAVTGFIAILMGIIQRTGIEAFWGQTPSFSANNSTAELTIIEERQGIIVMTEKTVEGQHIIVQMPNFASWWLVSKNDLTAYHPSLSTKAEKIAYASRLANGQIVVVSLSLSATQVISAASLAALSSTDLKVCEWTSIAWSPDDSRLAFSACNSAEAVVIVANIGNATPPQIVPDSRTGATDTSQLAWSDEKTLFNLITNADGQTTSKSMTVP